MRPGRSSTAAISEMLRADVLDAITASASACRCTSASSVSLRSIFSGAASMTTPAPPTASATEVVVDRNPSRASALTAVSLPSSTLLAKIARMTATAFCKGTSATS